jgi:beta-N-acetylhexosaminidase
MEPGRRRMLPEGRLRAVAGEAERPGQLLFVGFPGTRPPALVTQRVREGRVGGVVLFRRNVQEPAQLRELVAELREAAPPGAPLLVAIDQEGGRVQRLRAPWTEWPPMRRVAARGGVPATRAVAAALARELHDLGIQLDFAPVVDLDTNPANPVIADRSFGASPAQVGRHAAAFVEALQAGGVAACAKHFPGHGDTTQDSHHELPRLAHDLARLRRLELTPFRAAIRAGVASVMTAHVLFPALDAERPATLSPSVLRLLREELGFDGVVFSDDLEMRAVADRFPIGEGVVLALRAGVDALLVCSDEALWQRALGALEAAPVPLLEAPLRRVAALKARFAGGARASGVAVAGPPYEAHRRLAQELA